MGLEGAVKLAYRKELAAIEDAQARKTRFDSMVAEAYERGTALNTATYFEVDDVIDPAATRALVAAVLLHPEDSRPEAPRRRYVDSW
jgi:acetyl-CoA carboxylase carboxyltransferase component